MVLEEKLMQELKMIQGLDEWLADRANDPDGVVKDAFITRTMDSNQLPTFYAGVSYALLSLRKEIKEFSTEQ